MKTKYVMYFDYGGLCTGPPEFSKHQTFEVEHPDNGLDGIEEARLYVSDIYEEQLGHILNCIDQNHIELSWTRDIVVYDLHCYIKADENEYQGADYVLFSVHIVKAENHNWVKEYIKDDFHSVEFAELAKIEVNND